jgi:hypothetical protein
MGESPAARRKAACILFNGAFVVTPGHPGGAS